MLFGVGKLGAKVKSGAVGEASIIGPDVNSFAFDLSKTEEANDFSSTFVPPNEVGISGFTFNGNGTVVFYARNGGFTLYERSLSTAYDLRTATGSETSYSTSANALRGFTFANNGFNFYGAVAPNVRQWNLSTAYDFSTATLGNFVDLRSLSNQNNSKTQGVQFKPDGTVMHTYDYFDKTWYQYTLSTAFDITSTNSSPITFNLGISDFIFSAYFSPDGTKMYYYDNGVFKQRTMSTAFDISTAGSETSSNYKFFIGQPSAVQSSPDGTKFYFSDLDRGIYQTVAGTASDVTTASFDATKIYRRTGDAFYYSLFFKTDGTKMYYIHTGEDKIKEVDLSVAWDIASGNDDATLAELDISAKDTSPYGMYIKPDGTELYVMGSSSDSLHQYTLSTAWDVTSGTFTQSFDVSSKETIPSIIEFKPDGTKMYIGGFGSDAIHEYDLSTAWDISTSTFNHSSTISLNNPFDAAFNSDGSKIFLVFTSADDVIEYALSTPYDITTMSETHAIFINNPRGIYYKNDGTRFFIAYNSGIQEYITDDKKMVEQIYSPAINVVLSTAETGSNSDYTGDYDILDVEFIPDELPSDFSGRLYIGHKLRGRINFDLCIGAVQILNSSEARVHAWQGSDFTNWDTSASDALTLPSSYTDVTGYEYLSIASGSSSLRWNVASSTGTSATGAADGVSTTYGSGGSAVLPVRGLSQVSQTASTNFCYTEVSNSGLANGDYIWMRSPSVTLSSATLHHLRIAYNLTSGDPNANGTAKTYDTLQVFWSGQG